MPEGLTTLPPWVQTTLQVVASILAGMGLDRLYNSWLNRRKPAAEIHLTQATAAEVTVRASSSASDAMMRMMDRLDAAQVTIDRLRDERDHWERKSGDLQRRVDLMTIETSSMAQQMRRMDGFLKAKGLHLSDLDTPRE